MNVSTLIRLLLTCIVCICGTVKAFPKADQNAFDFAKISEILTSPFVKEQVIKIGKSIIPPLIDIYNKEMAAKIMET